MGRLFGAPFSKDSDALLVHQTAFAGSPNRERQSNRKD